MIKFEGIITALLTPLRDQDKIDVDGLRELIEFQSKNSVNGFFISGTTGEGAILSLEARKKLLEKVLELSNGNLIKIFQVGSVRVNEVKELIDFAVDLGVDAVASFPPLYYPYDSSALIEFYLDISGAREIPFFIYNIPPRTGINVDAKIIREIKRKSMNIVGVKDSSGDLKNTMKYLEIEDFIVLMGSDTLSLPGLIIGCSGLVSALSNVFPELFVKMYSAFKKREIGEARKLYELIVKIRNLFRKYPYISSYKTALIERGLSIRDIVNKPLRSLSDEEKKKLRHELSELIELT